jgi:5'-nucleotidase
MATDMTESAKIVNRILITNDDGIDAPGLAILEDIAHQLAHDVWVFAPDCNRSGTGRSLTITRDLKVNEFGNNRYSCDGTPTDCIILAMNHFMKDALPDLVLSGVNLGMNVADDITCSGTVGAGWEAVVHGVAAMALSQRFDSRKINPKIAANTETVFSASRHYAERIIRDLWAEGWPEDSLMNVNFPSLPADQVKGRKAISVGRHKSSDDIIDGATEDTYRIGMWRMRDDLDPETDVGAIFDGYISLCPLRINMTDYDHLPKMNTAAL